MKIDGLSREEIIEKYKPIIMLTLDREGLEELSKTDERVMQYKRTVDALHADENFMAFMKVDEENKELWSIIEQKEMNIRKIVNVNIKMYKKGKITMHKKRNIVCSY